MSDEPIDRVPPEVAERLGYYVYLYLDRPDGRFSTSEKGRVAASFLTSMKKQSRASASESRRSVPKGASRISRFSRMD